MADDQDTGRPASPAPPGRTAAGGGREPGHPLGGGREPEHHFRADDRSRRASTGADGAGRPLGRAPVVAEH